MEELTSTDESVRIIPLLSQFVAINSVYPHEKKIADFICRLFTKRKIKYRRQKVEKNRYNIIAEKGKGEKLIAIYAHLDTVAKSSHWKTKPLKLTVKGDRAYGLGAWDMKGGLTINLLTFMRYNPDHFRLRLYLCVDEENISLGAFRLIGSEQGATADCVISTEPAFQYGNQGIVVGRIGRSVFHVNLFTPSRHFYKYETAKDINLLAACIIKELTTYNKKTHYGKQFIFLRHMTTLTNGLSTPQHSLLEFDASSLPPDTNQSVLEFIKKTAYKMAQSFDRNIKIEVGYRYRPTPFLTAYRTNSRNAYLNILKKTIGSVTKHTAKPYFRSSVADENVFASEGITVLGIGATGGNAHSSNEWVSLSSLNTLLKILNQFLKQLDDCV